MICEKKQKKNWYMTFQVIYVSNKNCSIINNFKYNSRFSNIGMVSSPSFWYILSVDGSLIIACSLL